MDIRYSSQRKENQCGSVSRLYGWPPIRLSSIQVILYTASEIVYTNDNTTGYEYEEEQSQKQ